MNDVWGEVATHVELETQNQALQERNTELVLEVRRLKAQTFSLHQDELKAWQTKNFGPPTEDQIERLALGMGEEVGELQHYVLKAMQKIREGFNSACTGQIADAFGDVIIYGIQLMSAQGLDAEAELSKVIQQVLARDWVQFPKNGVSE